MIDEAEAEIVRLIFHKYVYEGYGAQKLSHYLYEQGVVGRNNKNIPNTSIVRMIKNKCYTGYLINGAVETECPQLRIIEPELFEQAHVIEEIRSEQEGFVEHINAQEIGICSLILGGGRETKDSQIDPTVGLVFSKKVADPVKKGDLLATIYGNEEEKVRQAVKHFKENFHIAKDQLEKPQMIKQVLS